jgi:type VI protein secretion system component Hcp
MPSDWCDCFLKLVLRGQPIYGEATDKEYENLIEVISLSFGSSAGFGEEETQYAAHDADLLEAVSKSRAQEDVIDMGSLFGDGPSDPVEYDKEELKQFEGKDLASVEACKITITKELDLASPNLFRAYCSTQDLNFRDVFESATLYVKKATGGGRKVFLTFIFNDVVVTGYTLDIGSDAVPKETVNLVFAKCCVKYQPQTAGGDLGAAIPGGWDMIERTRWTGED